jgi:RNA polymerase sigma-70 factor (ECF subfamily)
VSDSIDEQRAAPEQQWVERVRDGDVAAFEQIFRTYYRPLCAFAYGFVKSRDTADDVVQTVFTRIWMRREQWEVRNSLSTYLYAATRNQALNTAQHLGTVYRIESAVHAEGDVPAGMGRPSPSIVEELEAEAIWQVIAKLPERSRLVLTLRWEHDMGYAEIAEVMGITPKSVEIAKSRALKALRKLLPNDLA